jgi:hypothetical protein
MRSLLFILFKLNTFALIAQQTFDFKRDYEWVLGEQYNAYDTVDHIYLNFRTDSLILKYKRVHGLDLNQTNASVCDTTGQLLFYSNGCVLLDSSFQYIVGADTINRGPRWNIHCASVPQSTVTSGYAIVNGCWILPVAENKFKVYYADLINSTAHSSGIRFATVERDPVSGKLKGRDPDSYLFQTDLQPEIRGVVRHANGRDYWMVNEAYQDKKYYISLIDSTATIHPSDSQYFAELPEKKFHGGSQGCFSPDGEKYFTVSSYNQCQVFDFDRCTGKLSNVVHIPLPVPYDSIYGSTGIAISPNSRFMYLMTATSIWQYDLTATNIEASKIRVAQHDGWNYYINNIPFRIIFYQSQLGPDGKIYIFPPAGRAGFSVIDQPDLYGTACNVIQHKYTFPDWGNVSQPPRFPNFRLGPEVGSPCDTLTSATNTPVIESKMILRPNPAIDYSVVDITTSDYSEGAQLEVEVSNTGGAVINSYKVPPYAALQRIETSMLPNGMYFVTLQSKGMTLKTEKLVVLRE